MTRNMTVRLLKSTQARLRERAVERGVTVPVVLGEMLGEYAAGPKPKARRAPNYQRNDRTMTVVPVSTDVYNKARARASAENRSISAVLEELLGGEEAE